MWFGTRTVVHTGLSVIHSAFKDDGNTTSTIFFLVVVLNHPPLKVLCFRKSHFKCELCKRDAGY